ncbi:hypothetical protein [Microbacterium sp. 18062]|uniref:hypothetical protein n=1 Tax=Microbacterium sp. 18062 TaxID=2681410 RepID=UPI00135AB911|nr:hypothetical protein [Microbacterium sp. 18062]
MSGVYFPRSGKDSILGGTQIGAPVEAPVTIGGNAVSVSGDSTTDGSTTIPTTPTVPTDPGTPTDPTDPGTPVTPGTPDDDGAGTTIPTTSRIIATVTAAADGGVLAETGGTDAGALGLVAGLLLAAGVLLIGVRRLTQATVRD